ncbi:MAG: carboxylesterase family protein, partial [Sphingomonadaceae bacterium]|nr:carboxylesterase family protein [Sphingomonadaceae bacterium]
MKLWIVAVTAALLGLAAPPSLVAGPRVAAPAGPVRGTERDGVRVFKGLPYALPPVGEARWKPPVAPPAWTTERDATRFAPACMQPVRPPNLYSEALPAMSEDCLALNIWSPSDASKLPVFVWIHGGALTGGASSLGMYDGARLAKRGLVVVTINYRLGILGYLAHPGLSAESTDHVSGNYGLMDQIAALEWVKRNAVAFGGDPDNVTVAGESAGALSVMYLMTSPLARGLFAKAVAQSAYMISTPELREDRFGAEAAEATGTRIAEKIGAGDVAALRALPAHRLIAAAAKAGYMPWGTVDGRLLPRQLVDSFDRGEQAPVPLLAGYNSGEIRTLRFLLPPPVPPADYEAAIGRGYGDLAAPFLAHYPSTNVAESMLATTRDAMYGWTSQRLVAAQAALGSPSYLYVFDHGYPASDDAGLHAFHAAEIPFIFGTMARTPALWPKAPGSSADLAMTQAMIAGWTSFSRTGTPDAAGHPDWPA